MPSQNNRSLSSARRSANDIIVFLWFFEIEKAPVLMFKDISVAMVDGSLDVFKESSYWCMSNRPRKAGLLVPCGPTLLK